jgi:hypothetical protein
VAKYTNYEFNEEQNRIISGLANRLLILGVILVVIGTPLIFFFIKGDWVSLTVGALYVIMCLLSFNSYAEFKKIVTTQQQDITHLMAALTNLTNMYTLQLIAVVAAALAFAIFEFKLI